MSSYPRVGIRLQSRVAVGIFKVKGMVSLGLGYELVLWFLLREEMLLFLLKSNWIKRLLIKHGF